MRHQLMHVLGKVLTKSLLAVGSVNGLAPNRWQTITWSSVDFNTTWYYSDSMILRKCKSITLMYFCHIFHDYIFGCSKLTPHTPNSFRNHKFIFHIIPPHWTGRGIYRKIYNIRCTIASSCSCLCPIQWSQVLSREWRCSWSSADRRCSNYIWVINNFIAYKGTSYIIGCLWLGNSRSQIISIHDIKPSFHGMI